MCAVCFVLTLLTLRGTSQDRSFFVWQVKTQLQSQLTPHFPGVHAAASAPRQMCTLDAVKATETRGLRDSRMEPISPWTCGMKRAPVSANIY